MSQTHIADVQRLTDANKDIKWTSSRCVFDSYGTHTIIYCTLSRPSRFGWKLNWSLVSSVNYRNIKSHFTSLQKPQITVIFTVVLASVLYVLWVYLNYIKQDNQLFPSFQLLKNWSPSMTRSWNTSKRFTDPSATDRNDPWIWWSLHLLKDKRKRILNSQNSFQ